MSVRVKICGVTTPEDARLAVACGADLIGLNFYPPSPRYVDRERACRIRESIGAGAVVVGLFVNAERKVIEEIPARSGPRHDPVSWRRR